MKNLCVVLWDQLSLSLSSLKKANKQTDIILLCEDWHDATYVKHHKKKLVLIFSAMRHFAKDLQEAGYNVKYIRLEDSEHKGTLLAHVQSVLNSQKISSILITHPGEYRQYSEINKWQETLHLPVKLLEDDRYMCTLQEFNNWAGQRKQLRMEFFYREMRKKHNILIEQDEPVGGSWNYDQENRKKIDPAINIPNTYHIKPDKITHTVIELVKEKFGDHFGDIEPFHFAVTRADALDALHDFIRHRLQNFGDYQDAMVQDEPWLFHAHISFYLNSGLLLPNECIQAAEQAYRKGLAQINAVEGFIRQILGWREYVRGIYWREMPRYAEHNHLHAKRKLPDLYWTGETKMNCLSQCVKDTKKNAYAHHIQRLMILGNFALLCGFSPAEVNEWFLIVYADAYEWVEMPNVSGMVLYADGGLLASKPYAAGGNYINKMSNYCANCEYNVKLKNGTNACPFNYLYWDFMNRNRQILQDNPRVAMLYRTYDRMDDKKKKQINTDTAVFLEQLAANKS